jgi:hypothetical protein
MPARLPVSMRVPVVGDGTGGLYCRATALESAGFDVEGVSFAKRRPSRRTTIRALLMGVIRKGTGERLFRG